MGLLRRLGLDKSTVFCEGCAYYDLYIKDNCSYGVIKRMKNKNSIGYDIEYIPTHTCQELNSNNNCKYWESAILAMMW